MPASGRHPAGKPAAARPEWIRGELKMVWILVSGSDIGSCRVEAHKRASSLRFPSAIRSKERAVVLTTSGEQ